MFILNSNHFPLYVPFHSYFLFKLSQNPTISKYSHVHVCFVSSESGSHVTTCSYTYCKALPVNCTSNVLKLGFRRTSSNIEIKEATTIAAYVAYTHKPLRTNEVLGVRKRKLHFVK